MPERLTIDVDSNFFKEGEVIQFPLNTKHIMGYTAIKVLSVIKQIETDGVLGAKSKIKVHAERYA